MIGFCPDCSKPVTLDHRFRFEEMKPHHVNCDNPSLGTHKVTVECTVSPSGTVTKMAKASS